MVIRAILCRMVVSRRFALQAMCGLGLASCGGPDVLTCRFVVTGDSIPAATHVGPSEGYAELAVAAIGGIDRLNIAVGSSTIDSAGQGPAADALYDGRKQVNICFVGFGANDGVTKTSTQFLADLAAYVTGRRAPGFKVITATMLPCGSYDSVAFRAAINPAIVANVGQIYGDVICDFGNTSTTMGAEAAKNDGSLYSDTVHPTTLGNTLLEPSLEAALRSLMTLSLPHGRGQVVRVDGL